MTITDTHANLTSEATCHSDIHMLIKLMDGSIDNRNLDLRMLDHLIEVLTSPLGDNARTGRLFEEIFPSELVDSFSAKEIIGARNLVSLLLTEDCLLGYWTDGRGGRVLEELSADRHDLYTARARSAYVRLWMIPTAWLNLRGYLRHIRNTDKSLAPPLREKIDWALKILDENDYWEHALTEFRYVTQ